jgi:hypothetical protein
MTRHASAEDLASLDLDGLKPRKAARVRAHVATCVQCTQLVAQVSAVPVLLASVPYPSMPPSLAEQLDAALAREAVQRLANAPATEAGRRDLPARHARKAHAKWQLPGLSVLGTRLVAAAGAVVIAGVGGYEVVANTSGSANRTAASSTGSAASLPSAHQVTVGPTVQYGQPSAREAIQEVHAGTNFTRADLGPQAVAAVEAAKLAGANGTQFRTNNAPTASGSAASNLPSKAHADQFTGLSSCLDGIVGSRPVQLLETAQFEGKPATIIVSSRTATASAEVWVVGPACSASHPDVLAHETLSHT